MAQICKNGGRMVRANFYESELYSGSPDAPDCHFLDDRVLDAVQCLRNWSGAPIKITSTFRTELHNNTLERASATSQHLTGRAIDFRWESGADHDKYVKRIREALICSENANEYDVQVLTNCIYTHGVRGIGFYEDILHIDTRLGIDGNPPQMGMWDLTNNKYDKFKLTGDWYRQSIENGGSQFCNELNTTPPKGEKKNIFEKIGNAFIWGGYEYDQDGQAVHRKDFLYFILVIFLIIIFTIAFINTKK
tara:strand:+ start:1137 stop:1883 length:747 start_codon:yes stop_codon:yes gene_type:complete